MNITPIIESIFTLIAAIIAVAAVPYIRSKTTATQQAEIAAWVKIAVTAAEQIYNEAGKGKAKKAYVEEWLAAHGVTVDADKIDAMIEAAVFELKNGAFIAGVPVTENGGAHGNG